MKDKIKVIIAGGRKFNDWKLFYEKVSHLTPDKYIIISGCATGADTMAIQFAEKNGYELIKMPADWQKNGKAAGFIRNYEMAKIADELIALPGGVGTQHMIKTFNKLHHQTHHTDR